MTPLQELEVLAALEEAKLRSRYSIGYANGIKSAVLDVRCGASLEDSIAYSLAMQHARAGEPRDGNGLGHGTGARDEYDEGFIDGLRKAQNIMLGRGYP